MNTYIINFRGHGALSETKTLEADKIGLADAAKSAAEYWCRSHRSPFAVYEVEDIVGTVSVDVDAPYTVFVTDPQSGARFGHDFRTKYALNGFCHQCKAKGIKHAPVTWLKKKKASRVAG